MKIAIQAADLDSDRIDGTRVYIFNLLKHFGKLDPAGEFLIYHRKKFNPELIPSEFTNYRIKKIKFPFYWTQLRFAAEIWKDQPDILWMPMQTIPFARKKSLKVVITIHDLAFKYFPDNFPKTDLQRLNFFSGYAIRNADKIISVSQSTKNDILKFYPEVKSEKIRVIYHGFDPDIFSAPREIEQEKENKKRLAIKGEYLLYVGAIQPRKNLVVLIEAFERLKKERPDIQLVLAGEKAWKWDKIIKKVAQSPYKKDIIMPGRLKFDDLGHLMRGAAVFILPSLYEGFGIPILEALASKIPVITADNSSLREVGGEGVIYFNGSDSNNLAEKIEKVLADDNLRKIMLERGLEQIKKFSWEKCAQETLDFLKS